MQPEMRHLGQCLICLILRTAKHPNGARKDPPLQCSVCPISPKSDTLVYRFGVTFVTFCFDP